MTPETLYAKTGDDVWIAYQTLGDANVDLVLVNSWVSHLEVYWEEPRFSQMIQSFANDARVINFDKRGTGSLRSDQSYPGPRSAGWTTSAR